MTPCFAPPPAGLEGVGVVDVGGSPIFVGLRVVAEVACRVGVEVGTSQKVGFLYGVPPQAGLAGVIGVDVGGSPIEVEFGVVADVVGVAPPQVVLDFEADGVEGGTPLKVGLRVDAGDVGGG